jgi:16S rRNA (cytosine967-C5)-methyltransferase
MSSSGRDLALEVLNRVEINHSYANLALSEVLETHTRANADRKEKAFCTELVYGTLRNLMKIDYILGRLLSRPLHSLKTPVKNILRIALYQLLHVSDIPERAVCHSAVEQVKASQFAGLSGFVNGVLRNFLRIRQQLVFPDRAEDLIEYLAVEYSHPQWLIKRWLDRFGAELTERILAVDNEAPPLTVRVNSWLSNPVDVQREMAEEGVSTKAGLVLAEALVIETLSGPVEDLTAFKEGKIFIQDESSMWVAKLLNPQPQETIIDMCAAPGGKSTHLAELMKNQGRIISIDDHPHKIDLIRNNAARLRLNNIQAVTADARSYHPPDGILADAVLVDAPCSGTGVLRRRVDSRYRRRPEHICDLVETQRAILDQAARLVRPGGRLVYSTCTLEPEENELQIGWFLEKHPNFWVEDWRTVLSVQLEHYLYDPSSPWVLILPTSGGGDGFFICRMSCQ